jgi:four helix bundle protein
MVIMNYNLEERTATFAERIIALCQQLSENSVSGQLVNQLVRAGTSIGANYCEADNAESRRDFRHKIGICRKESRETKYWLRLVAKAAPIIQQDARQLWTEATELNLIFSSIIRTMDKRDARTVRPNL